MTQRRRLYLIAALALVAGMTALLLMPTEDVPAAVSAPPPPASASQAAMTTQQSPPHVTTDGARSPITVAPQTAVTEPPRHTPPVVVTPPNPPAAIEPPASAAVAARGHLDAEDAFVTDRMVDVRAFAALVKGDDFDRVMDELSAQSSQSPLAKDLTALISAEAARASASVDGVAMRAMACGLKLCVASMTATSADAMTAWTKAVVTNPQPKVYTMGRHDRLMPDGSIEYRLVLSIDPAIRASGVRPPG